MNGASNQYFADFQLSGHLRFPALSGKPYFDQTISHFRSTLLSLKLRSYLMAKSPTPSQYARSEVLLVTMTLSSDRPPSIQ